MAMLCTVLVMGGAGNLKRFGAFEQQELAIEQTFVT